MSSNDSLRSLTPLVRIEAAASDKKLVNRLYAGFEETSCGKCLIDVGRLTKATNHGRRLVSTAKWKQIAPVPLKHPIEYSVTDINNKHERLVQCAYAMVTGFLPKLVDVAGRRRKTGGFKSMMPDLSGIEPKELEQICALLMEDHCVKGEGKERVDRVLAALRAAGTKPDGSAPGKAGKKVAFAINLEDILQGTERVRALRSHDPVTFDGHTLSIEDFLSQIEGSSGIRVGKPAVAA